MSLLTDRLDKVASALESHGLLKEAEDVDVISNTLEAFEKEAWSALKSPIYKKFLEPAMNAAAQGNADIALKALNMGAQMKKAITESRPNVPEFKFFSDLWDQAIQFLKGGDVPRASDNLQKAFGFMQKMEPIINAEAPGYAGPKPGQQSNGQPNEMVFPAQSARPGASPKRAPIPHPARAMR